MTTGSIHAPELALRPAVAVLADAERRLRTAAAEAAAKGEYDALDVISRWAKTIQSLSSEASWSTVTMPPSSNGARTPNLAASTDKVVPGKPAFSRDADMLVKTARSKKSKSGYEHRAPFAAVSTVAECLSEWRPNRKLLTGEELLNEYAKRKGGAVSYQVYAALGWLVHIGLVRRHGRSGYSVPQPDTISLDVKTAWESLKIHRAR